MAFHDIELAPQEGQGGVGRGEKVIVDEALRRVGGVKKVRAEILGSLEWHVTAIAVLLGLGRIVERARPMAGSAAKQIGVVVVLPALELFVAGHLEGQPHFVTDRAVFRRLHERLEKSFFVELRLGLDQDIIQPLEGLVFARGERIVNRFFHGVGRVANRTVDVRDTVAAGAGDACVRSGMFGEIKVGIIKRPAEEGDDVMASGAPARGLDVAVPSHCHLAGFLNAKEIAGIVKRTEPMRAVKPSLPRL